MSAPLAERVAELRCTCGPCPGRGNDGHGMTHCAECCYGTYLEDDPGCDVHHPDIRAALSDPGRSEDGA